MDLEGQARALVGARTAKAVSDWLAELATARGGPTVARHIRGEQNLPLHNEGTEAIRRLAGAMVYRPKSDPVEWYKGALNDPGLDLVLQGPNADPVLPDELCKLVDAWTVWKRYGRGADKPKVPAASTGRPGPYQGRVERWLRNYVCSPTFQDALDPAKQVSGNPPVVFSTFEEDRNSKFPSDTLANTARQIVGLDPRPTPVAHALFRYGRARTGPAKVPTAFDAGTHVHFLPPPAGAACGTTKNLTTPAGSNGVREVVVKPFSVSTLSQPEFVPA